MVPMAWGSNETGLGIHLGKYKTADKFVSHPRNLPCSNKTAMETAKDLFQKVLHLQIWLLYLSVLYLFSEAVKSPDRFMPSVSRVNNMKSEWIQESQFSRLPLSDTLIPQEHTPAYTSERSHTCFWILRPSGFRHPVTHW